MTPTNIDMDYGSTMKALDNTIHLVSNHCAGTVSGGFGKSSCPVWQSKT